MKFFSFVKLIESIVNRDISMTYRTIFFIRNMMMSDAATKKLIKGLAPSPLVDADMPIAVHATTRPATDAYLTHEYL